MSSTTSGLVRTRFSLQPSSAAPPKSVAVRFRCCWKVLLLTGSPDEMVQVPKKSGVSGHLYFTQVLRWIPISGIEVVLFSREWRIGGTEVSDSTSPETMHEPTPEILNIAGARPKLPRIAPLMQEMQRHPVAVRDRLAGQGKAGRI